MPFETPGFRDLYLALEGDLRRRVPALTDWEEGSVVRSLFESFAVEMALLYEQMDRVYQAGFVDTATGPSLDRVVAVLGITRNEPDFATGVVTFERDPGSTAELSIPAGTLVTTRDDPDAVPQRRAYVTIEEVRLRPGQTAVDARVQAEERGSALTTAAGTVTMMPRPVPGVKTVRNERAVRFLGRDREADDELRERARKALLASGRASTTAIENALLGLSGVRGVRVVEDFSADAAQERPGRGVVKVYVDGLRPENSDRLRARVDEVRAAGIFVVMEAAVRLAVRVVLRIEAEPSVRGEELDVLEGRVADAVVGWLDRQRMGQPLLFSQLTREVLALEGIVDLPDLRIATFAESGEAEGTVILDRGPGEAAAPLAVPRGIELRTASGQRFVTVEEGDMGAGETEKEVRVRALLRGPAGELARTGSASPWRAAEVKGTTLAVRNPEPLRLARTVYDATEKRLDARPEERFVAERVRVAAGEKTLAVHVIVPVSVPAPEGSAAAVTALVAAIAAAERAARPDDAWAEGLDAQGRTAVEKALKGYFDAARDAAAGARLAGALDEATHRALVAAVEAYFEEARGNEPVRIAEGALRDRLDGVMAEHLTPQVLRRSLEEGLAAALALLAPDPARFPADAVAEALRAGVQRAADQAVAARAEAVRAAAAALAAAKGAEVPARKVAYEEAQRDLETARAEAARTLAEEVRRVPERVDRLRASAAASLEGLAAPEVQARVLEAAASGGAFALGVRLRTVSFDGEVRDDQPYVEPSFVERPEASVVFVHTRELPLAGLLALDLPLTATAEEKEQIRGKVREAIADYLDGLGPEEPVMLDVLRATAALHPRVVGAAPFVADPALRPRLLDRGTALRVDPQERAVLSATRFLLGG